MSVNARPKRALQLYVQVSACGDNGALRSATYCKSGSPKHLSALINLCLLIERHKKLILARAEPGRSAESKIPQ